MLRQGSHMPGQFFFPENSLRFLWQILKFPWRYLVWYGKIFWPPHTSYSQPDLHLLSKSFVLCFQLSFHLFIYQFIFSMQEILQHISSITRHSENDNTPQPLDQNSPFMGQKVWKLYEFHIDLLLGQCSYHALCPKSKLIVRPTLYPIHISFILSIDLPIPKIWLLKIDLENPRSRSWVRSKLAVTIWV